MALEQLALRLLEYDGACARSAAIDADLKAVERFFDDEAWTLARAIAATGYDVYPVPQRDRDAVFLRYRDRQAFPETRPSCGIVLSPHGS